MMHLSQLSASDAEAAKRLNNQPYHTTHKQMIVEHTKMTNLRAGMYKKKKYEKKKRCSEDIYLHQHLSMHPSREA